MTTIFSGDEARERWQKANRDPSPAVAGSGWRRAL